jgi:hypothetical protein
VDPVPHLVRFERATDFPDDLLVGGNLPERERPGRRAKAGEVVMESEDATVVEAEALPHGVTALHGAVERAHPRLVTMRQDAADVDDEATVSLVELLQHGSDSDSGGVKPVIVLQAPGV